MKKTVEQRFLAKVNKTETCWLWTASIDDRGYGRFGLNGRNDRAHRVAYRLFVGPITEVDGCDSRGTCVCHKCDNRLCVNPEHLFLGSQRDNLIDRDAKGRTRAARGAANGQAQLTELLIEQLRDVHRAGVTYRRIADVIGVHKHTIYRAITGKTYRRLP